MRTRSALFLGGLAAALAGLVVFGPAWLSAAEKLDARVVEAEKKRIAAVNKISPAVVAIFIPKKEGQPKDNGGSGVIISPEGYALTNFHVVQGRPVNFVMPCGLSDGVMYDAVCVGIDPVGDVALVKLLPKKEGQKFPYVALGDSDKLQAGDWSFAMGNPWLLATDFQPTVTYGLISGVNRYPPEGGFEYGNSIQIDTSINPGNSGGPLFNVDGELIGINGRGSFDKRGRVNSGVGYAISINQIKNFLGHFKAGLVADHASLGATVGASYEEDASGRLLVRAIKDTSDVRRRGLDLDDELLSFAGRTLVSPNQFKNVLSIYPRGWRVPLVYRQENDKKEVEKREVLVRLEGWVAERAPAEPPPEAPMPGGPGGPRPGPPPRPEADPQKLMPNSPAWKMVVTKPGASGMLNLYFNKLERDRLLAAFKKYGDFSGVGKQWTLTTEDEVKGRRSPGKVVVSEEKLDGGKGTKPVIKMTVNGLDYDLEPLKAGLSTDNLKDPRNSGGLLLAMYHWHQFLTAGEKGFPGNFSHAGNEPFYPPMPEGQKADFAKQRVDCEVMRTEVAGVSAKWYFDLKDAKLLGFELYVEGTKDDPCEVHFSEYKAVGDGRQLPHKMDVVYGDKRYASVAVQKYEFADPK
jgi:serine protease Do